MAAMAAACASGTNSTFRQVGIATGIAALGALFQVVLAASLPALFATSAIITAVVLAAISSRTRSTTGMPAPTGSMRRPSP